MAAIPPQLIGESPEFHALLDWVSDIASLNVPVLVLGEAGVGKEITSSRIHFLSPRWEQSYHSINCAAFSAEDLVEMLFDSDGLLTDADGGTLFIDNIEYLNSHILERLTRLVEYGDFQVPDGQEVQAVDVRLVFSANPARITRSKRREVLSSFLDRLATDVVHIPPLRDRVSDIAPLMLHFGRKMASKIGAEQFPGVTSEAMEALMSYQWPDNIRELKSVIERSTARAFLLDETLTAPIADIRFSPFRQSFRAEDVPVEADLAVSPTRVETSAPSPVPQTTDFTERVFAFERGLLDEAMQVSDHHQGRAADYLGLTYHQFRGMLRKHGLKK